MLAAAQEVRGERSGSTETGGRSRVGGARAGSWRPIGGIRWELHYVHLTIIEQAMFALSCGWAGKGGPIQADYSGGKQIVGTNVLLTISFGIPLVFMPVDQSVKLNEGSCIVCTKCTCNAIHPQRWVGITGIWNIVSCGRHDCIHAGG